MKTFNSSVNHHSIPTLPKKTVIEILLRLPVKSLLRCKSVCKSWHSLISDTLFVKSHLSFSTSKNNCQLILHGPMSYLKSCPLYDVMDDKSINSSSEIDPRFTDSYILGSFNGLLCLKIRDDLLFWNPSTRRSNKLPYSRLGPGYYGRFSGFDYGFGYDESTQDYKVVAMSDCRTKVKIYSLKSGIWKKIGGFPFFHFSYRCKFSNGALHWAARPNFDSYYTTIVSLDLATETYGEFKQPVYDGGYTDLTIGALGECLSVVYYYGGNRLDVWVMKVYGVQDSWTKFVSIQDLPKLQKTTSILSLCFASDGKILFQCYSNPVLYDIKNGTISEIENLDGCAQACTIVESLVSPEGPRRRSKRLG